METLKLGGAYCFRLVSTIRLSRFAYRTEKLKIRLEFLCGKGMEIIEVNPYFALSYDVDRQAVLRVKQCKYHTFGA